jgi:hypothetical protein
MFAVPALITADVSASVSSDSLLHLSVPSVWERERCSSLHHSMSLTELRRDVDFCFSAFYSLLGQTSCFQVHYMLDWKSEDPGELYRHINLRQTQATLPTSNIFVLEAVHCFYFEFSDLKLQANV